MKIPQADDFAKVLKIPVLVHDGMNDYKLLASNTGLNIRQIAYYSNAAEMLGLIKKDGKKYNLTDLGTRFVSSNNKKQIAFDALKATPIISELIKSACLNETKTIYKSDISRIIQVKGTLSESTAKRRANSILSWFYWISYHYPTFSYCDSEKVRVYCEYGKN